jgi:hypothetical protein
VSSPQQFFCSLFGTAFLIRARGVTDANLLITGGERGIFKADILSSGVAGYCPCALSILSADEGIAMSWDRPFDQPVPLPSGAPARTLRDAANYIKKLPKSEYDCPEWRLAVQMLIDASEDRGPMLFARIGINRAIERQTLLVVNSSRKPA